MLAKLKGLFGGGVLQTANHVLGIVRWILEWAERRRLMAEAEAKVAREAMDIARAAIARASAARAGARIDPDSLQDDPDNRLGRDKGGDT